jgi:hypothetical protein
MDVINTKVFFPDIGVIVSIGTATEFPLLMLPDQLMGVCDTPLNDQLMVADVTVLIPTFIKRIDTISSIPLTTIVDGVIKAKG